jgi:lipopolysaccharide/colanic/teichoic acid biosynthesis glycosyltransferase
MKSAELLGAIADVEPTRDSLFRLAQRCERITRQPKRSVSRIRRIAMFMRWRLREGAYRLSKRIFDVVVAAIFLIVCAPMMLFVAIAIKLTDRGPVLFWQKRVGQWGQTFECPKFRSMVVEADQMVENLAGHNHHGDSITFKIKEDPRVTGIGRFLRRFSFDEFPQLWCVLRGEMSMVGPRPALPREVYNYSQLHRRRLEALPGLTCIWQISGRADVPFHRQLEMDMEYLEYQCFWLDVKLLLSTFPAVLAGRGAY